jgi:intracellular sulfur oxidation DsrE/DsrF family protein
MRVCRRCLVGLAVLWSLVVNAESPGLNRYVAEIELQTASDLATLLDRAEALFLDGELRQAADDAPVVLVLHGPVLRSLLKPNYVNSRALVDRAASLSALGVLDVRACRSWMTRHDVDEKTLQPFVRTVAYGPGEVRRLIREQGYISF